MTVRSSPPARACFLLLVALLPGPALADPVPHGQDTMPGPALSPAEAMKKMTLPPGFHVELVAAEPDIVNPVAMTFDERGRIWITESLEYPRQSAGPGRDRIKVLESTKGDGRYDKITVFAEGLNIPSGIAVGHGGVWVANSPDILFYREGPDGKAAGKPEVVVTGFGRHDTHELPNSLSWGPDGWLYGLNGVFNRAVVEQNGRKFDFTCALFRIHPKTREFQLFCEGTSNPWGVTWDPEGSAFVSACVIDHLWHLTETGYYHRQGGPYPPYTWELPSIVQHHHQKAAYCGIHYFDSDAYPPEYRDRLYMGNIHGGCINVDTLTRNGSTYVGTAAPDFLTAHDAWFMPVAQKTGPDGCLYILDWYDRYHCYQDANRDPNGIDRLRGRLYRIRYKDSPPAGRFDLARETDEQLIERLRSPNIYFRDQAQRLLAERGTPALQKKLEQLVLDDEQPRKGRMHALWARVSCGPLGAEFHQKLLAHADAGFRAWGVRAAGNEHRVDAAVCDKVLGLVKDPSPDVLLQVVIAAGKLDGINPLPVYAEALQRCGNDRLIPVIVWQNLYPRLEDHGEEFLGQLFGPGKRIASAAEFLPRVLDRLLGRREFEAIPAAALVGTLVEGPHADPEAARRCFGLLAKKIQNGELSAPRVAALREHLNVTLRRLATEKGEQPLRLDAALLLATFKDSGAFQPLRTCLLTWNEPAALRERALDALIAGGDPQVLDLAAPLLTGKQTGQTQFRAAVLAALGKLDDPRVADVVLAAYSRLEPDLQPRAIELLTQRMVWGKKLIDAVGRNQVPASALNVNQVRRLLASKDAELVKEVKAKWGTIREGRNPEREQIVKEMRTILSKKRGNATAGWEVFKKTCAQCHKIYGEGQDVGPDITANGRGSFEQLLSNVFDPSLVIGASYQATTVFTTKGRVLTGLVVEDNDQRVVLKLQGGKVETVPRGQVQEVSVSPASLMPEGFEKQLQPQELLDLFAFLTLDRPPNDPKARLLPGTPTP